MSPEWISIRSADLAVLRVQGADATGFLQGQLSNDVTKLSAQRSMLAGFHNPQGRVIALLRLVWMATQDIVAIVPRELAGPVLARLSKYVLRSKVQLAEQSNAWRITGLIAPDHSDQAPLAGAVLPDTRDAQAVHGAATVIRVADTPARWLVLTDAAVDVGQLLGTTATGDAALWRRLDVAAGLAQVYQATSEEFVAQMLNLDALGAVSFDKGCYTGQEVIARSHYRGRVKRRMQRFRSRDAVMLRPADVGRLADGRTFKVVDSTQLPDGRSDFLAVAPLAAAGEEQTEGPAAPSAQGHEHPLIAADQLALPYSFQP